MPVAAVADMVAVSCVCFVRVAESSVLFVKVSVVALPTNVSVADGIVNVLLPLA